MKWVFVVNRAAGNGVSLRISNNIKNYCKKNRKDYYMHFTKSPGEATRIALKYRREKCVVFAVGGDGTVNEVLNGVVGTKNILGVIPAGSGNDFYKTLREIPENFPSFDVGKINDMYFINTVCFGMDAEVANNIELMKVSGVPKRQLYYASIMYTFFKYRAKTILFKLNNTKIEGKYMIFTICNGKYYGNGFKIAPGAIHDDGLFDIYYVDELSKNKILPLILKLKKGKHESSPLVRKQKSKSIILKTSESIICNVDGEKLKSSVFKIKMLKRKIIVYNNKDFIERVL